MIEILNGKRLISFFKRMFPIIFATTGVKTVAYGRFFIAAPFCLLFILSGCSGGQLSLPTATEKPADKNVVQLDENGLPSIEQLMVAGPLGDKSLGRADALVTIIEYMSLTCPHCRAFHQKTFPTLKRDYIDTGKVRYIVREFPIGRSSGNAAIVTRCGEKDRTFKLIDLFLNNQPKWVSQEVRPDAIYDVAKGSGLSRAEFDQCMKDQTLIDGLNWVKNRGRQLGVTGTPTFFINGKKIRKPLSIAELKAFISSSSN